MSKIKDYLKDLNPAEQEVARELAGYMLLETSTVIKGFFAAMLSRKYLQGFRLVYRAGSAADRRARSERLKEIGTGINAKTVAAREKRDALLMAVAQLMLAAVMAKAGL